MLLLLLGLFVCCSGLVFDFFGGWVYWLLLLNNWAVQIAAGCTFALSADRGRLPCSSLCPEAVFTGCKERSQHCFPFHPRFCRNQRILDLYSRTVVSLTPGAATLLKRVNILCKKSPPAMHKTYSCPDLLSLCLVTWFLLNETQQSSSCRPHPKAHSAATQPWLHG